MGAVLAATGPYQQIGDVRGGSLAVGTQLTMGY